MSVQVFAIGEPLARSCPAYIRGWIAAEESH